jgi:hypothetical protein
MTTAASRNGFSGIGGLALRNEQQAMGHRGLPTAPAPLAD